MPRLPVYGILILVASVAAAYGALEGAPPPKVAVVIDCAGVRELVPPALVAQASREAVFLTRQLPGPPAPALPFLLEGFRRLLTACGISH